MANSFCLLRMPRGMRMMRADGVEASVAFTLVQALKSAVVIGRVIELAVLAGDDTLRARSAHSHCGMDEFVVIAGRLSWQTALAILKYSAVVGKIESLFPLDSGERGTEFDIATIGDLALLVADGLVGERSGEIVALSR
jgi:hypothetical protein